MEVVEGSHGGQFRLGARGERTGYPSTVVADFNALGRHSAWVVPAGGDFPIGGYIVIFQAPWFGDFEDGTIEDLAGSDFRLELQINACSANEVRDSVMVWNNAGHGNWQNMTNFGIGTLYLE
jgi:hypothetical protein